MKEYFNYVILNLIDISKNCVMYGNNGSWYIINYVLNLIDYNVLYNCLWFFMW